MSDSITNIFVISDSVGETGLSLITAGTVQFPNSKFNIRRFPLTKTISLLQGILNKAKMPLFYILLLILNYLTMLIILVKKITCMLLML